MHVRTSHQTNPRRVPVPTTRCGVLLALALLAGCGGGGGSGGSGTGAATGDSGSPGDGDTASGGITRDAIVQASSLPPGFDAWERHMTEYGRQWGEALVSASDFDTRINLQYYDAQRVHEQIARYLGSSDPWKDYAEAGGEIYKRYLENADFRAAGYMRFPHGLFIDAVRNGDEESRQYLAELRDEPPYSYPAESNGEWSKQKYSREIAYSLETHILADRAGFERKEERIRGLADLALGHVNIWVTGNYIDTDPDWQFTQAFMAGLTASALIAHYERSAELGNPDAQVQPALERLGEFLWDTMWVADVNGTGFGAFEYVQPATSGVGTNDPAPDLNMLIAPMYGWLYYRTGDDRWLRRGDVIFAGGVALSNLGGGKQFNQNYRSSFQYVDWRTRGIERHGG